MPLSRELALTERQFVTRALQGDTRLIARGLRGLHACIGFGSSARVEERRGCGKKRGEHRAVRCHRISGLQLDALETAGDRRGDDVSFAHARDSLLVDGHAQRAALQRR